MFDINDLMSPKVREQFDNLSHIRSQAVFLVHLLDYTQFFPDEAEEITRYCKETANTVYDTSKFLQIQPYTEFIKDYAVRTCDINKVKDLINELCSGILHEMDNFDEIIDRAKSAFEIVESIDDFEFTDSMYEAKSEDLNKKSLADILKYKELIVPPKPKKEKKKK